MDLLLTSAIEWNQATGDKTSMHEISFVCLHLLIQFLLIRFIFPKKKMMILHACAPLMLFTKEVHDVFFVVVEKVSIAISLDYFKNHW